MSALLTADWCPHGRDEYYRKFEIGIMQWSSEIKFDAVTLSSSKFGGPIAVVRNRAKIAKVAGSGKPVVSIYSASGLLISSFIWSSGKIIQMGWSSKVSLLCVQEEGSVLIYDMFGNYQHKFSMGKEAEDTKVVAAQLFDTEAGTGVAVLTTTHRVFLVNNVREPHVRMLPEVPGVHSSHHIAWLVISEDRHSRVLYARGKELYCLHDGEQRATSVGIDMGEDNYNIVAMGVSCNKEYLAVLTDRGKLWLGNSDATKCLRLFDTRNLNTPQDLVWCGTDCAVINWGNNLEAVGFTEDSLQYSYDSGVFLVQEVDCVRIISLQSQEILQRVPHVVRDIFRINSTSPGCYLLEASKQFQKKSHRSNEYLHLVKSNLTKAVNQCVEAAGHEFNPETQKMLMKAAQFGKTFLEYYDPQRYVAMCRILRCLNAIRDPKIALPLTCTQLEHLKWQGLLDLLVIRRYYFLAIEIATFLKMKDKSEILSHWACYKVEQFHVSNEQVALEIAEKLGRTKGVSYTAIARKAADCGRSDLAIKLIDYEPRANEQVMLLLELGEGTTALTKAIDSGNTDLVYTVLLSLKEHMPLGNFQMAIRNLPMAQALYIKYCQQHNRETLKDIYQQEDNHNALAECYIRDSYKSRGSRESSLTAAQEGYKRGKNDVHAALCEEQLRLLKLQRTLDEKYKSSLYGCPLQETLQFLLLRSEVKQADKLKAEFKVPDRRYWWLRIQVLSELNQWQELEAFAKSKKSPIGYEPFVDICWNKDRKTEALKYLPKVKEEFKVKYLVKFGMLEEAAQLALEQRNLEALQYVQSKSDRGLAEKIGNLVNQLSKK